MSDGFYAIVTKLLAEANFSYLANAKGSHEKWRNAEGRTLIVPRNLKSRHTANAILKDAGISRRL